MISRISAWVENRFDSNRVVVQSELAFIQDNRVACYIPFFESIPYVFLHRQNDRIARYGIRKESIVHLWIVTAGTGHLRRS